MTRTVLPGRGVGVIGWTCNRGRVRVHDACGDRSVILFRVDEPLRKRQMAMMEKCVVAACSRQNRQKV